MKRARAQERRRWRIVRTIDEARRMLQRALFRLARLVEPPCICGEECYPPSRYATNPESALCFCGLCPHPQCLATRRDSLYAGPRKEVADAFGGVRPEWGWISPD